MNKCENCDKKAVEREGSNFGDLCWECWMDAKTENEGICELCCSWYCEFCDGIYVSNGEDREHTLHDCESIQRLKEQWNNKEKTNNAWN